MEWQTFAAVLGAATGSAALVWRFVDSMAKYLHIELRAELSHAGFLSAYTVVENRGSREKQLWNAVILVGPEEESPLVTMANIGIPVASTNAIAADQRRTMTVGPDGRCLIPVPFYYSENVAIADERLSYRQPIPTEGMVTGVPYSVRFFIDAPGRLHRSTHDCIVLSD